MKKLNKNNENLFNTVASNNWIDTCASEARSTCDREAKRDPAHASAKYGYFYNQISG